MVIKYYTDTHIPKAVDTQLRAKGIDIMRCQDVGLDDASDVEHLQYATLQARVVVSHDRDFWAIHADWLSRGIAHCGVVLFSRQLQGNVGRIVAELAELAEMIQEGAASLDKDIYNQIYEVSE